jgi:O-antigen/teichoic acid export membrane protein
MRTVSHVFGTKVVDYLLKFITSILITRTLGPSDKGILTFAMLVVTWTVTFGNLSFFDANIYLLGSRKFSLSEAAMTSFVLSLVSGLLYALLLLAIVGFRLVHWPVGNPWVFFALLMTIPFNILANNSTSILQGLSWFKLYNLLTVTGSSVYLLAVVAARYLAQDRLAGIVAATVGSNIFVAAVMVFCLGRAANWKLRFSGRYLKEGLLFGLRGHVRVLLTQITVRFDQFVLGAMLEPIYLGWYSVAAGLSEGLLMLPDSVGMLLFPRVAAEPNTAAVLAARACRCTLLVTLAAAAALALCGKLLIGVLYGQRFLPATTPLHLLCGAIVFQSASRVLRNYFYGVGRPQLSLWSTGSAGVVIAVLIFPLVKAYGMVGAALTSLVAQAIGAAVDVLLATRVSATPPSQFIFPQRTDLRLAVWKP